MLEAMSAECAIVASNTPPVKEVIQNNHNGVLVDFFDSKKLAESVVGLLKNPKKRQKLGQAARKYAIEHYDLQKVCLPKQIEWVSTLLKSKKSR
jgi:glycosyltransferase involved in cell wall biosynthesis